MGIEVKSNVDISKIEADLKKKLKDTFDRALSDAATEIVIRTRAQKDAKGGPFKKLTAKYQKFKIAKGRKGVPDLTFSGSMLAAITNKVEESANNLIGRIFFNSATEAAKASGNQKIRKFFELSADQINKIKAKLQGK